MYNSRENKDYEIDELLRELNECNEEMDVYRLSEDINNCEELNKIVLKKIEHSNKEYIRLEKEYLELENSEYKNLMKSEKGYTSITTIDNKETLLLSLPLERQSNCSINIISKDIFKNMVMLRDLNKKNELINLHLTKINNI